MVAPRVGNIVKLRCIDYDIVNAFSTVVILNVPRVKVVKSDHHTYRETHLGPDNELEEVRQILFADAVISEDAMMVHVVNTPVASAAMVLS